MTKPSARIRVVVTEDSAVTRALLTAILEEAPGFELVAAVPDGAAAVDAVARLRPGVVGDGASVVGESFVRGLLDFPHYTRPAQFRSHAVPPVLLSGHHQEIARWRKREAVRRTLARRPDLLTQASLDEEERAVLRELMDTETKGVSR